MPCTRAIPGRSSLSTVGASLIVVATICGAIINDAESCEDPAWLVSRYFESQSRRVYGFRAYPAAALDPWGMPWLLDADGAYSSGPNCTDELGGGDDLRVDGLGPAGTLRFRLFRALAPFAFLFLAWHVSGTIRRRARSGSP